MSALGAVHHHTLVSISGAMLLVMSSSKCTTLIAAQTRALRIALGIVNHYRDHVLSILHLVTRFARLRRSEDDRAYRIA